MKGTYLLLETCRSGSVRAIPLCDSLMMGRKRWVGQSSTHLRHARWCCVLHSDVGDGRVAETSRDMPTIAR